MRLLNSRSSEMKEFVSEDDIPPYAILSHTWGSEEITFQQWNNISSDLKKKDGCIKIKYCSKQADDDHLEWVWVDTCCIDKASSAELSEAINAMFRWYANAAVCYVYLADVRWCSDQIQLKARISASRWFTRGWTLQELIAPSKVVFYTAEWRAVGTKSQLCRHISSITGIDEQVLNGGDLEDVCVARKMSWAASRKTTRSEDVAYCLLGIFDVNMPLIYGEGRKAFQRLQHEIMRSTMDQSLFAWGTLVEELPDMADYDQELGLKAIEWTPPEGRKPLLGLLAESPSYFKFCRKYSRLPSSSYLLFHQKQISIPALVDNGIMVSFALCQSRKFQSAFHHWDRPQITQLRSQEVAVLFCNSGANEDILVGLPLRAWGDYSVYARTQELVSIHRSDLGRVSELFGESLRLIHVKTPRCLELNHGDIVFRRYVIEFTNRAASHHETRDRIGHQIIQTNRHTEGVISTLYCENGAFSLKIVLRRVSVAESTIGALRISVKRITEIDLPGTEIANHQRQIKTNKVATEFPTHHHTMALPFDSWIFQAVNLPTVFVRAHRMPLRDGKNSLVDVVDLVIPQDDNIVCRMVENWNKISG